MVATVLRSGELGRDVDRAEPRLVGRLRSGDVERMEPRLAGRAEPRLVGLDVIGVPQ